MDSYDLSDRGLEGEECNAITALNTTYNNDDRVPTYVGVMFEIYPQMDMELLTIELDLRIPDNEVNPDLSVEIYTLVGSYELLKAYDSSRWTLVTKATAVLLPSGGAIIPASEFPALQINADERRSFYITMKEPYLDHNVMALQKTGELQMRTPELDILVGVGFKEYKFPGDYDRLLDPQFAGVLHLRRNTECSKLVATTTLEYDYVLSDGATNERLAEVSQLVDKAIASQMQGNSVLRNYQSLYGLEQSALATASRVDYEGNCPQGWEYCPKVYLKTSVDFVHRDTLHGGTLLYEFYRVVDSITNSIRRDLQGTDIFYVGYSSVSADLSLTLTGVPEGQKMDDVQLRYLADEATRFLQEKTDNTVEVWEIELAAQSIRRSSDRRLRHSRSLGSDVLQLDGRVLGSQTNIFKVENFRDELETTFDKYQRYFLDQLVFGALRPGEINEGARIEYFRSLNRVDGNIQMDNIARTVGFQRAAEINSNTVLLAVLLSVAVAAVAGFTAYWFRRNRQKEQKKADREEMKVFVKRRSALDRHAQQSFNAHQHAGLSSRETCDSSEDSKQEPLKNQSGAPLQNITEETPSTVFGEDPNDVIPSIPLTRSTSAERPVINYSIGNYPGATDDRPHPKRKLGRSLSFDDAGFFEPVPEKSDSKGKVKEGSEKGKYVGLLNGFLSKQKNKKSSNNSGSKSVQPIPSKLMTSSTRKNSEAEDISLPVHKMPSTKSQSLQSVQALHNSRAPFGCDRGPMTPMKQAHGRVYERSVSLDTDGFTGLELGGSNHGPTRQKAQGTPPSRTQSYRHSPVSGPHCHNPRLPYGGGRGPMTPMRQAHGRVYKRAVSLDDAEFATIAIGGGSDHGPTRQGASRMPPSKSQSYRNTPITGHHYHNPRGPYGGRGPMTPMRHAQGRLRAASFDDAEFTGLDLGGSGHGPSHSRPIDPHGGNAYQKGAAVHLTPPGSRQPQRNSPMIGPPRRYPNVPMTPMRNAHQRVMKRASSFDDALPQKNTTARNDPESGEAEKPRDTKCAASNGGTKPSGSRRREPPGRSKSNQHPPVKGPPRRKPVHSGERSPTTADKQEPAPRRGVRRAKSLDEVNPGGQVGGAASNGGTKPSGADRREPPGRSKSNQHPPVKGPPRRKPVHNDERSPTTADKQEPAPRRGVRRAKSLDEVNPGGQLGGAASNGGTKPSGADRRELPGRSKSNQHPPVKDPPRRKPVHNDERSPTTADKQEPAPRRGVRRAKSMDEVNPGGQLGGRKTRGGRRAAP